MDDNELLIFEDFERINELTLTQTRNNRKQTPTHTLRNIMIIIITINYAF